MKQLVKMLKKGQFSTFGLVRIGSGLAIKLLGLGGFLLFLLGGLLGFILGVEAICRKWGILPPSGWFYRSRQNNSINR